MRVATGLLLLGILVLPLTGQQPGKPPPKPTRADVAKWIAQLGSEEFDAREEAQRKLWDAGNVAEAAVAEATKSTDAEVARRAKEVLDKFRWGIYPDTPQAVIAAIGRYQAAAPNGKMECVRELLDAGTTGCKALAKIARQESIPEVKQQLLGVLANELGRSVPDLLATGQHEVLQELLEVALDDPNSPVAQQNYAAYWLLAGKLDERIAHHKALLAKTPDKRGQELLALLCRAKGDYKEAIVAALKAGNEELVDNLLYESANWAELVKRGANVKHGDAIESLGYRAAFARLAGDQKAFDERIDELKKAGEMRQAEDDRLFQVAKALFLNDRPDLALAILERGPYWLDRMQILLGQLRYKEAFDLVQKARDAKAANLPALELLAARTRHQLGEKDEAKKVFEKYAALIKAENDLSWLEDLIDAEAKAGLRDAALEHTGKILSISNDMGWPARLFGKLFPGASERAEPLWLFLQQRFAGQDKGVLLRQLRDLLEGKYPLEPLRALAKSAPDALKEIAPVERQRALLALAECLRVAGEEKLALTLLGDLKYARALQVQGDMLLGKKHYAEAAEKYKAAFDLNRQTPVPLYLSGWALEKAGKVEEGKARMEQAHWLSLGREDARDEFIRELTRRGHEKALAREVTLLRRTSQPGDYYAGEAIRRDALFAVERKEYATAAAAHELAMLRCLRSYINFLDKSAYVGVPAMVHSQRAAALAQAGKYAEAKAENEIAMTLAPGAIEGTIRLVQVLDKAGKKADADALFERAAGVYRAVLKDYPDAPSARNSVAWLSATCKRNLAAAQKDAERAVALDPQSPGYLDTLAEITFQLGDKDKAVALQKKVVALSPKRGYFKKQLARLEAGDRNADLPPEEDEEDEE